MRRLLLTLAIVLATGCAARGSYGVTASVHSPELAYVGPGVYAVADYHEPVFYSDNYYWRYYNNGWYRSNAYNSGWTYYSRPPRAVVSIRTPQAYVRYRPSQRYIVDRDRRVIRDQRGDRRDNRRYRRY